MNPLSPPPAATARQLMHTAERLFAADGLAGVSLRQIASEAGSANSSAVRYHFGSKEGLDEAILAYRLPDLVQRRALLKARLDPDDLSERLEAHLLPVLELAESPESHYVSFVECPHRSGGLPPLIASHPGISVEQENFLEDMRRLLPGVAEPVRTVRITQVQAFNLHAAAERELASSSGEDVMPFGLFVAATIEGFAGYVAAPVSDKAQRFLARSYQPGLLPVRL